MSRVDALCSRVLCAERARITFPLPFLAARAGRFLYGMIPYEARQQIMKFMGGQFVERWPEFEACSFLSGEKLTYAGRIALGTFLFGNLGNCATFHLNSF